MFLTLADECPHHVVRAFLEDRLPSSQPWNVVAVNGAHVRHVEAGLRQRGLRVDCDTAGDGAVQPQTLSLIPAQSASCNLLDLRSIEAAVDSTSVAG